MGARAPASTTRKGRGVSQSPNECMHVPLSPFFFFDWIGTGLESEQERGLWPRDDRGRAKPRRRGIRHREGAAGVANMPDAGGGSAWRERGEFVNTKTLFVLFFPLIFDKCEPAAAPSPPGLPRTAGGAPREIYDSRVADQSIATAQQNGRQRHETNRKMGGEEADGGCAIQMIGCTNARLAPLPLSFSDSEVESNSR